MMFWLNSLSLALPLSGSPVLVLEIELLSSAYYIFTVRNYNISIDLNGSKYHKKRKEIHNYVHVAAKHSF